MIEAIKTLDPEALSIVESVLDLPPESLFDVLWTDDQRNTFVSTKLQMILLGQRLNDFFSGRDSSTRILLEKSSLNTEKIELTESFFDFFISFYSLVQPRWSEIKERLQKYGLQEIPSTPGEALIKVVKDHCDCQIDTMISPYKETIPSQQYFFRKTLEKHKLAKQEGKVVLAKKYQAAINKLNEPIRKYHIFRKACVFAAEDISKGSRNYRSKVKSFKESEERFIQSIMRTMHPRKGQRGWVWRDGEKNYFNEHGDLSARSP